MTLKLKKFKNDELGIYDEEHKKFVPLRGKNISQGVAYLRPDIREYFMDCTRKDLVYAAKVILKSDEDKENDRLAQIEREKRIKEETDRYDYQE